MGRLGVGPGAFMKACPSCGSRNEERGVFCNDCGLRLSGDSSDAGGHDLPTTPADPLTASMHGGSLPGAGIASAPTPVAPAALPQTTASCSQCGYRFPGGMTVNWCPGCGALLDGGTTTSSIPSAAPAYPEGPTARLVLPPTGWALVLLKAGERLDRYPLRSEETVIGRTEGTIRFPEDALLSPHHATVVFRPPSFRIEDAGSQNGVYRRLPEAARLRHGDLLNLGSLVLRFDDGGKGPRSTALLPPSGDIRPFGTGREKARGSLTRILQDGSDGPSYPLTPSRTIFGRKAGNFLFPEDPLLSRQHAQFYERDGEMWVEDLGSSNGTLLRLREPLALEKGMVLRMGDVTLEVSAP